MTKRSIEEQEFLPLNEREGLDQKQVHLDAEHGCCNDKKGDSTEDVEGLLSSSDPKLSEMAISEDQKHKACLSDTVTEIDTGFSVHKLKKFCTEYNVQEIDLAVDTHLSKSVTAPVSNVSSHLALPSHSTTMIDLSCNKGELVHSRSHCLHH